MTSESHPIIVPVNTISSGSDDSDDDGPVPVSQVRRRMPMCLKASEIDTKTKNSEEHFYTNKFLNYRKIRMQFVDEPNKELLDDKSNCDIEEEEDSIFTEHPKTRLHSRKILAVEKHVDDIINSVAVVPETYLQLPVETCPDVPLVTQVSQQTASLLKEFEEATSLHVDPNLVAPSDGSTSVSFESIDFLCLDELQASREVSIRVRWNSAINRFTMQNNEPFSSIISKLANVTGAEMSDILLALRDTTIKHSDTPDSIDLRVFDIIDCYVIKMIAETVDDSVMELKLQSDNRWKKVVKIHKDSPMQTLIDQCASEKDIPANKVVFKFDGEVIDPSESPADLDLESGLCIDVTFLP